jgi:hypothetical protein
MKTIKDFVFDVLAIFLAVGFILGCGNGGSSDGDGGGSNVTLSGEVREAADPEPPVEGATVQVRSASDRSVIASTTTDSSGKWSLKVPKNTSAYLQVQKSSYATLHTFIFSFDSDESSIDLPLPDESLGVQLVNAYDVIADILNWSEVAADCIYALNVEDSGGSDYVGATVTVSPVIDVLYNAGDDTYSLTGPTASTTGMPMVGGQVVSCTAAKYTFTADESGVLGQESIWLIPGQIAFIFIQEGS